MSSTAPTMHAARTVQVLWTAFFEFLCLGERRSVAQSVVTLARGASSKCGSGDLLAVFCASERWRVQCFR